MRCKRLHCNGKCYSIATKENSNQDENAVASWFEIQATQFEIQATQKEQDTSPAM